MLCNWTRWTTYLRQEIFLLIEDKSKVQVATCYTEKRSCGTYSCVCNHIQAGYLWRREYSMNYFTYPHFCNSNITIGTLCLKSEYFHLRVQGQFSLKQSHFPLGLKTQFLAVVCEVIELILQNYWCLPVALSSFQGRICLFQQGSHGQIQ